MSPALRRTYAAVALFLFAFPLVMVKPGMPINLKSDEPAYYLMALSLVRDLDLRCDLHDIQRLVQEFPYTTTKNLILATGDRWQTVYFGKPYLVSLVAAPLVALFGANGFVATNMALLLLSVWLGALYLRQFNPEGLALLYSAGFFLLSNAFAYVFWLHTEVLCIASVTIALYLAFTPADGAPPAGRWAAWRARLWNERTRPFFSGAALIAAAYNKPYLAALGLPALALAWRGRSWRGAATWVAGFAAAGVLVCGISWALIGKPSAYLGLERAGVSVESYDEMPPLPKLRAPHPTAGPANSFRWILTSFRASNLRYDIGYFLLGRHTGLFVYAPFALLSVLLFLAHGRRSGARWFLAATLAGVAFYTLTFIWFNWHGGGGFIGNRYYVNALPGFLFLVTRIAPAGLVPAGYAAAGLFVGSIAFTPFGNPVPAPTLQAHVRNAPFRLFPLEHTLLRQIPGYRGTPGGAGTWIQGRTDLFRPLGEALWVVGGQRVELDLLAPGPLARPVFEVSTRVAPNRVRLALGRARTTLDFASAEPPGNVQRVALAPGKGKTRPDPRDRRQPAHVAYTLTVEAERQAWHRMIVPFRESKKVPTRWQSMEEGIQEPDWTENELDILVGAVVTYLGEEEELARDVYAIDWLDVPLAAELPAGRIVSQRIRLRNASDGTWRSAGATQVAIAYHWRTPEGEPVVWEGWRTPLRADVGPGEEVALLLEIETPKTPGRYVLELDAVRERIAWFSDRRPESVHRLPIDVVP
jgi:hypothetical protein